MGLNKTIIKAISATTILVGSVTAVALSLVVRNNSQKQQELSTQLNCVEGFNLRESRSYVDSKGVIKKEFTYVIAPLDADTLDVKYNLFWDSDESNSTDDNDFSKNNIKNYITVAIDTAQKKVTLSCAQPFGKQAKLQLYPVSAPKLIANVKLNYQIKELSKASVTMIDHTVSEGEKLKYTINAPSYSIGTLGNKASENKSITWTNKSEIKNFINGCYSDCMGDFYDGSALYIYKGVTYTVEDEDKLAGIITDELEKVILKGPISYQAVHDAITFKCGLDSDADKQIDFFEHDYTCYGADFLATKFNINVSAYGITKTANMTLNLKLPVNSFTANQNSIVF